MSKRLSLSAALLALTCAWPLAAQQATPDLAARVAKLEQSLGSRGLLELLREIESLKQEVQALRGQLENQTFALEQAKKAQIAGYLDLDKRLQGLEGGAGLGAAPTAPLAVLPPAPSTTVAGEPAAEGNLQVETTLPDEAPLDPTAAPAPPAIDPLTGLPIPAAPAATEDVIDATAAVAPGEMAEMPSPPGGQPPASVSTPEAPTAPLPSMTTADDANSEAAYRDAFALLKSGEYDQAIGAFETFQQQYPNSQYGDNAQFWLAEAHYVKRDFQQALPAYQTMLARYPASKKLSHAMLKIGYSYAELGQTAEARSVLEELQQRFPGSAAAQLAAQRISQLAN